MFKEIWEISQKLYKQENERVFQLQPVELCNKSVIRSQCVGTRGELVLRVYIIVFCQVIICKSSYLI